MKYFVVEGNLHVDKIDDDLMQEHMAYTQKKIDEGVILTSGLKSDMSGGLFIIKSNSIENLSEYLDNEPFKKAGAQSYKVIEFTSHYINEKVKSWF
ncbi:MAG: hypothetical protein IJ094_07720 [Bacilli bacterium]|nr:hypothetical protein [Bacilli bacterium]